jgi:hypothetical protein
MESAMCQVCAVLGTGNERRAALRLPVGLGGRGLPAGVAGGWKPSARRSRSRRERGASPVGIKGLNLWGLRCFTRRD